MLGSRIAMWQICCRIVVNLSVGGVRSRCSGVWLLLNTLVVLYLVPTSVPIQFGVVLYHVIVTFLSKHSQCMSHLFWSIIPLSGHTRYCKTLYALSKYNVASQNAYLIGFKICHNSERLKLTSLERRHLVTDLLMCYKMVFGLISLHCSKLLQLNMSSTRWHKYKLLKYHCGNGTTESFFGNRVINVWNSISWQV